MKRFQSWLKKRPSIFTLVYVVPLVVLLQIILIPRAANLVHELFPNNTGVSSNTFSLAEISDMTHYQLFISATLEELALRFIPFMIVQLSFMLVYGSRRACFPSLIACIVITSVIFGYVHGNFLNVFIQGIGGLILSIVFLKYGGYIKKNYIYASFLGLLASTLCHFSYNVCMLHIATVLNESAK